MPDSHAAVRRVAQPATMASDADLAPTSTTSPDVDAPTYQLSATATSPGTAALVATTLAQAQLDDRSVAAVTDRAGVLAREAQRVAARYESLGIPADQPLLRASQTEIRDHLLFCTALERLHHVHVDPSRYFGLPPEQIEQRVRTLASARKRGVGARAVRARYGDEAAFRITGHRIRP